MHRCTIPALLALALGVAAPGGRAQAQPAETRPLWEAGVAGFALYGPDYPAADEYALNALPAPYLIYRGEALRLGDGQGAALVPFRTARLSFGISASGAFPAESDGNRARAGMPDLDTLLEFGPELVLIGPGYAGGDGTTELAIQARGVASVGGDGPAWQGLVLEPKLRTERAFPAAGVTVSASLSAVIADERLQDYFYEVDPAFARPGRAAFDATAGYLGAEAGLAVTARLNPRTQVFGGVAAGLYEGAANTDSPLHRAGVNGRAFLGLTFSFYQSRTRAPARQTPPAVARTRPAG